MTKAGILVVDDEPRYLKLVSYNLEAAGYEVIVAPTGEEALPLIAKKNPDLIILDIRLPGIDGYEVCTRIREFSSVPIIMLTAKGEEQDRIKGLRLGADDYVTKPFSAGELMARVEAVLRRSSIPEVKTHPILTVRGLSVDFGQKKVVIRGKEVNLSPTEFRLLGCLVTNRGAVLTHDYLLENVWGPEYKGEYEILRVALWRLRQKVEENPSTPRYILTCPRMGFMLATSD